jgi:guanylate kinase
MKKLIILTAPSGSGKTTIVKKLLNEYSNIKLAITYTTRLPRIGEIDGIDYNFVSIDTFENMVEKNEFLEYEEVYYNQFYGSSKTLIDKNYNNGYSTIMILDVKGALKIKEFYKDDSLILFIKVSDIEILRKRLIDRGDILDSVNKRMDRVSEELEYEHLYDKVVYNDNLDDAINNIKNILNI